MSRSGHTLIELLVVLAIVAVTAALAGVAVGAGEVSRWEDSLMAARRMAIRTGRPSAWIRGTDTVQFFADGSASRDRVGVGRDTVVLDILSGLPRAH